MDEGDYSSADASDLAIALQREDEDSWSDILSEWVGGEIRTARGERNEPPSQSWANWYIENAEAACAAIRTRIRAIRQRAQDFGEPSSKS